jgi:hypothetical protein
VGVLVVLWVYNGKGGYTKEGKPNQKPDVRTTATLVLVRERLEHEYGTVTTSILPANMKF